MLTLAEARARYSNLSGGHSFRERIDLVIEKLLPYCNAKGTKVPVGFRVYTDKHGNKIVTLPRELETIEAGAYQASDPNSVAAGSFWCGRPIPVQNEWYQYIAEGPGVVKGSDAYQGFKKLSGFYTTFIDWDESMKMRIDPEEDESPGGTIIFRGRSAGDKVYVNGVEGVSLTYSSVAVQTTRTFDEPPYQIIKPRTKGRLKLYAVDADDNATLAAIYEPDETTPVYTRFIVPVCEASDDA